MWQSGIKMFMDKKLLGFGPGRIKDNYAHYANLDATPKSPSHLHNNIVHLAAERGVFALGAWIWVWIGYFVLVIQRIRDTRDAPFETRFRMIGGLAVAAGFLSAGMFEYNFGDSEVVMLMFMAHCSCHSCRQGERSSFGIIRFALQLTRIVLKIEKSLIF